MCFAVLEICRTKPNKQKQIVLLYWGFSQSKQKNGTNMI